MDSLDLIPRGSRVILKRKEVEKVGSIFIPNDSRQMRATEGEVVAVGDSCEHTTVGSNVFFGEYAGQEITRNGAKFYILNEDDILANIKEK